MNIHSPVTIGLLSLAGYMLSVILAITGAFFVNKDKKCGIGRVEFDYCIIPVVNLGVVVMFGLYLIWKMFNVFFTWLFNKPLFFVKNIYTDAKFDFNKLCS